MAPPIGGMRIVGAIQLENQEHSMTTQASEPYSRMIRHQSTTTPRLIEGESPPLIAYTTSYGLCAIKVTHYDVFDEDSSAHWSTACSSGFAIERAEVLWWAYADEVLALIEEHSCASPPNLGAREI